LGLELVFMGLEALEDPTEFTEREPVLVLEFMVPEGLAALVFMARVEPMEWGFMV
jgi:hypothetical protein